MGKIKIKTFDESFLIFYLIFTLGKRSRGGEGAGRGEVENGDRILEIENRAHFLGVF